MAQSLRINYMAHAIKMKHKRLAHFRIFQESRHIPVIPRIVLEKCVCITTPRRFKKGWITPNACAGCRLACPPPPCNTRPAAWALQRCQALALCLLFRVLLQFTTNKAALAIARELQVEAHANAAAAAARRVLQPRLL